MRPGDVIDGTPEEVLAVLADAPEGTIVAHRQSNSAWQSENGEWELLGSGVPGVPWTTGEISDRFCPLTVLRWGHEIPEPKPAPDAAGIAVILWVHRAVDFARCACGWDARERFPLGSSWLPAHCAHQAEMIAEDLR